MSVVKQMFAVLVTVGVVSSLALAATYTFTQPRIEQNILRELQESILKVLPDAETYETSFELTEQSFAGLRNEGMQADIIAKLEELKDQEYAPEEKFVSAVEAAIGKEQVDQYKKVILKHVQVYYRGFNEQKQFVGYAFATEGSGFQGNIGMIVGIEPDLDTLLGVRVLSQVETPGLGAKIASEVFKLKEESFVELGEKNVPANILAELKSLKGRKYTDEEKLLEELEKTIGGDETERYDSLILVHTAEGFQYQFSGLKLDLPASKITPGSDIHNFIIYVKNMEPDDPNEIQAITGATISSKAVVDILNQSLTRFQIIVEN